MISKFRSTTFSISYFNFTLVVLKSIFFVIQHIGIFESCSRILMSTNSDFLKSIWLALHLFHKIWEVWWWNYNFGKQILFLKGYGWAPFLTTPLIMVFLLLKWFWIFIVENKQNCFSCKSYDWGNSAGEVGPEIAI